MTTNTLKPIILTEENCIDSVKMMREIRDKLSLKIMNMTFEQEKEFIRQVIAGEIKI